MTALNDYNRYGEELEKYMILRTSPLAIKMLEKEGDIPEGTMRPKRDEGFHLAQCQAFSMSRRRGTSIAMLKEDNWCWGSLLAYGLIDPAVADKYPELRKDIKNIPLLEYGRYIGILSAPLKTANFKPDIVMIYSNPAQLRHMLHVLSYIGEGMVNTPIYPVASCALSVVPALSGQYCVTLPDPGEYGRALATEDEVIFSVPEAKLEKLVSQITSFEERNMGYRYCAFLEHNADFARPEFYKKLYRECGLDADDIPTWSAK
jgi:uncharacterized protein (DUF169 family)